MRYLQGLSIALLTIATLFILSGCEKEEIVPDRVEETADVVWAFTYPGIEVVQDEEKGNYLSFKKIDDVRRLTVVLTDKFTDEKISRWEKGLDFVSLNSITSLEEVEQEPGVAAVLNADGYIKVGGVLYKDAPQEDGYYTLEGESKILTKYEGGNKASCFNGSDYDSDYGGQSCSGRGSYLLSTKLYTTYSYWSQRRRARVRVSHYSTPCNSNSQSSATGNAKLEYSYSFDDDDGGGSSGTIVRNKRNISSFTYTLFYGQNMCVEYVNLKVTGTWSGATAVTQHYK